MSFPFGTLPAHNSRCKGTRPVRCRDARPITKIRKKVTQLKDYDTKIKTPKKCIRDYCLMRCDRDKRLNSKRDVVECVLTECPLHPYRTGQLKGRRGPISENTKRNRIARLERARYYVTTAEKAVKKVEEQLQRRKNEVKDYEGRLRKAERKVDDRKKAVRKLEILFNDELEAGIWNSKRLDVDEE